MRSSGFYLSMFVRKPFEWGLVREWVSLCELYLLRGYALKMKDSIVNWPLTLSEEFKWNGESPNWAGKRNFNQVEKLGKVMAFQQNARWLTARLLWSFLDLLLHLLHQCTNMIPILPALSIVSSTAAMIDFYCAKGQHHHHFHRHSSFHSDWSRYDLHLTYPAGDINPKHKHSYKAL